LIGQVVNLVRERAEEIEVYSRTQISPDPEDHAFGLCAEDGNADFIVTLNITRFLSIVSGPGFSYPASTRARLCSLRASSPRARSQR